MSSCMLQLAKIHKVGVYILRACINQARDWLIRHNTAHMLDSSALLPCFLSESQTVNEPKNYRFFIIIVQTRAIAQIKGLL